MKPILYIQLSILLMAVLIVGCTVPLDTSVPPSTRDLTTTIVSSTAPETIIALSTKELITVTPIATRTSTKTNLVTPQSQLATLTPVPTLSVEEAKKLILKLMQEHSSCLMPCLWGFSPSKTDYKSVQTFADQFGNMRINDVEIIQENFGDVGGIGITYKKNNTFVAVDLSYYKSKKNGQLELLTMNSFPLVDTGPDPINKLPSLAPVYGDNTFNQELQDYLLPAILSTYGAPSQVLLATWPDDPDRSDIKWHPISLVLIYQELGIFVEYVSQRESVESNFAICPGKSHVNLGVWDPKSELSFDDIVAKAGSVINKLNIDYYRPIEEATTITLGEFYDKYKDPENTSCLETPRNLWEPY